MVMTPEGLSHWAIHSAHGWPSWLTLCFLTLGTVGTEKENADLLFRLVPSSSCTLGKREDALDHSSCDSALQISQCCILSHSPFLNAPRNKTPFVSDAFHRKKCSLLVSLLSTQGAPFCPILRQTPPAAVSKDFMQHNWSVSEVVHSLPASGEVCVRCDGCFFFIFDPWYSVFVLKRQGQKCLSGTSDENYWVLVVIGVYSSASCLCKNRKVLFWPSLPKMETV